MTKKPSTLVNALDDSRMKLLSQNQTLEEVYSILHQNEIERDSIKNELNTESKTITNNFNYFELEKENVYHINSIQDVCVDYRLRFLDSILFNNEIPEEAISKIRFLEKKHNTKLKGFKIMAPSSAFLLKKYDDPLLFVPIDTNYYYLIHKWGNEINPLRKYSVLPIKNLGTFTVFCLIVSAIISFLVPTNNLSKSVPMAQLIVFIFSFKSIVAVIAYYFFMMGKNFNTVIWNSPFKEN
ncbi:MAG: hypothetical protein O9267_03755 [Flavobacterium sp.]|uniref:hypothetical protein n=1 Tax=Flavobacterium sp. TaxID=239 RepID=UPI0022C0D774|nr:hypothetical protein [Flavobacterium sp.]MCZ8196706.1 hypothetical protein [Flavobacterium sp.]